MEVPRLENSEQYLRWASLMEASLVDANLAHLLKPKQDSPPIEQAALEQWELSQLWACIKIRSRLASSEPFLDDIKTAHKLWDAIAEQYDPRRHWYFPAVAKELLGLRLSDFNSVQKYIDAHQLAHYKLHYINKELALHESWRARLLLDGLEPEFHELKSMVIPRLNFHYDTTVEVRPTATFEEAAEFLRRAAGIKEMNELRGAKPAASNTHRGRKICTHCKRRGHDQTECWVKHPYRRPANSGARSRT